MRRHTDPGALEARRRRYMCTELYCTIRTVRCTVYSTVHYIQDVRAREWAETAVFASHPVHLVHLVGTMMHQRKGLLPVAIAGCV